MGCVTFTPKFVGRVPRLRVATRLRRTSLAAAAVPRLGVLAIGAACVKFAIGE